jgi:hypothetical protein
VAGVREAFADQSTLARREQGRLNGRLTKVERDGVDWYAGATKVFAADTEIGDLIRAEVPPETNYNPPIPGDPEPEQPSS